MAEIIRMPRMSDTMEEGNIVGWLKKIGDNVEPGDVLAEVETDKATMELESYFEGVLLHIGVEEGPVPVNGVLAIIGEKGEDISDILKDLNNTAGDEKPKNEDSSDKIEKTSEEKVTQEKDAGEIDDKKTKEEPQDTGTEQYENGEGEGRIKISPLARKMIEESGLDIKGIKGTGDGGRIIRQDVEAEIERGKDKPKETAAAATTGTSQKSSAENYEDFPVSQMRKVIAKRLGESKFSAPHFYLTIEVDMDIAIETRKRINEMADTKISFNDLVIKAVAVALFKHPNINSSWLGDKIRRNKDINIGVAVAVEEGLLVPVIQNANHKSLSQLNEEVKLLAGKAKEKKLQPQEMSGNTFTISNLGMFDIEEFTAIINPPDACILAVGTIVQKPVVKNGEIVVGNRMKVTLSCDHRVVDGATGAQFLQTFKAILEDPIRMIV